jgi:hypothetical protein
MFYCWNVNSSGVITSGSGWKTTDQALEADWQKLFGMDIKSNGLI